MEKFWDMHMHCRFSGDSDAEPEDMIRTAIVKGLAGICFTDHEDLDYAVEPEEFILDLPDYCRKISGLSAKYRDRISVLFGIELGLQTQIAEENSRIAADYPFDFIIGSSHVVDRIDPYYPPYFKEHSSEAGIRRYFESILENIAVFDDFDVYGHLDYIVRYAPQWQSYSYGAYAELIDEILRQLIAKGKGIEINTSGLKYGLGHPHPTEEILTRYRALGGEIVTFGSDAHTPEDIAYAFDRLPEMLKAAGFRYYTIFRQREAAFIPLP